MKYKFRVEASMYANMFSLGFGINHYGLAQISLVLDFGFWYIQFTMWRPDTIYSNDP